MVSIVTINYNAASATKRLVDSLSAVLSGVDYEVVVVDNDSSAQDKEALALLASDRVTVCYNDHNAGFAGGNNFGIERSSGEYILLLNNDTVAKDDFITPLVDFIRSSEKIGVVCSRIMDLENPHLIQFGGYAPVGKYMIHIQSVYHNCEDSCAVAGNTKTPFAHGAAMLFRRSSLPKVGMMPIDYFLYFEELDWSLRFTRAGYEIWCVSSSRIYHEGSHSIASAAKIYYNVRNRLWFAERNLRGIYRMGNITHQILVSLPKTYLRFLLRKEPELARAALRGVFDFLRGKRGECSRN